MTQHFAALRGWLRALVASALVTATFSTLADTPAFVTVVPGGVTFSNLGTPSPITAGGRTWEVTPTDPSQYGDLYYGIGGYFSGSFDPGHPGLKTSSTAGMDTLSFNAGLSNLALGTAVFSGTSTLYTTGGTVPVYTRFVLTVTDTLGAPLALTDPASLGMPSTLGGVLDVNSAFRANWQFLASTSSTAGFQAAQTFFNNYPNKNPSLEQLRSDVGGGFYATAPVPEAPAPMMLAAGLLVLGAVVRRRLPGAATGAGPRLVAAGPLA